MIRKSARNFALLKQFQKWECKQSGRKRILNFSCEAFKNNHGLKLFFMEANFVGQFCATKLLYQGIEPINSLLLNSSIFLSSDSVGFDLNSASFDVSVISFDVQVIGVLKLVTSSFGCLYVSKITQNVMIRHI